MEHTFRYIDRVSRYTQTFETTSSFTTRFQIPQNLLIFSLFPQSFSPQLELFPYSKNSHQSDVCYKFMEDESDDLRLSLSPPGQHHGNAQMTAVRQSFRASAFICSEETSLCRRAGSKRRATAEVSSPGVSNGSASAQTHGLCKGERIPPPYPWATDRRAVVHSLEFLVSQGMVSIRGDVVCKRCDGKETHVVDLQASFVPLSNFFLTSKDSMHDRAPKVWMVPHLLDCGLCHQTDCVKPVIDEKKRRINWLFLLLTQTLGLCTLDQLKYFCKHTKKHRTGAKDRVLYLTYLGLLKQLNPSGPYD